MAIRAGVHSLVDENEVRHDSEGIHHVGEGEGAMARCFQ